MSAPRPSGPSMTRWRSPNPTAPGTYFFAALEYHVEFTVRISSIDGASSPPPLKTVRGYLLRYVLRVAEHLKFRARPISASYLPLWCCRDSDGVRLNNELLGGSGSSIGCCALFFDLMAPEAPPDREPRAPNGPPRNQHSAGYRSRICLNENDEIRTELEKRALCALKGEPL